MVLNIPAKNLRCLQLEQPLWYWTSAHLLVGVGSGHATLLTATEYRLKLTGGKKWGELPLPIRGRRRGVGGCGCCTVYCVALWFESSTALWPCDGQQLIWPTVADSNWPSSSLLTAPSSLPLTSCRRRPAYMTLPANRVTAGYFWRFCSWCVNQLAGIDVKILRA